MIVQNQVDSAITIEVTGPDNRYELPMRIRVDIGQALGYFTFYEKQALASILSVS